MIKFFFKTLFILVIFTTPTISQIINEVIVLGNKRISKETIIILGGITRGIEYNNEMINDVVKELYQTNFFSEINLKQNLSELIVQVVENPIIEDINFLNIKKKSLIEEIQNVMSLKNRMSFNSNSFNKDIVSIKNFLKIKGFYFSDIKTNIENNEELNSVKIFLDIDLGKKAKIDKISFIGDKKINDKNLLEIIASEEHKFWKFLSNRVYLNQSLIQLDQRLLSNFYKNQGYYNATVESSFVEFSQDNEKGYFNLIYNINAGDKFYFNDFSLNLPDEYKESDFLSVIDIFNDLKGKKYSLRDFNLILEEIDILASNKLYDFIDAKVQTLIVDQNKLDFKFDIVSAEKKFVEKIDIFGNYKTIEEVIRNKFLVDEGDPLNPILFNKSINNIKSLGLFKSVNYDITDGLNSNTKNISITVEEQPTGEISLGAGYGTDGGTVTAGIIEKNFLGKGINLNTNFELTDSSLKGQFIYSKPNFAYTENTLFTSLSSTSNDNLTLFGYKVDKTSLSLGTRFEQYENIFISPEFDFTLEDLETNSTATNIINKQQGKYKDFYFNYGINFDNRNSSFKPSSGSQTFFSQNLPIISDISEVTNVFTFTKYKELNENSDMIGKASFFLKSVNSFTNTDARISKRAQIPQNRLRGFERGKIGPIDKNNDHIGGNYVSALNLSTSLPKLLPSLENIDLTYFIDVGNVWGVDFDDTINESSYIRSSTGLGIDFLTPIGPFSFSFSQPITKDDTDVTETFRFNLGTTF